nr:unnamed protein product [Spirometra erinaceieuropaei]
MLVDAYCGDQPRDHHRLQDRRPVTANRYAHSAVYEILFEYACAVMQRSMGPFAFGCPNFGLIIINTDKTVAMHQSAPKEEHATLSISVRGTRLLSMYKSTCEGSIISNNTKIVCEVVHRPPKPARHSVSRRPPSGAATDFDSTRSSKWAGR